MGSKDPFENLTMREKIRLQALELNMQPRKIGSDLEASNGVLELTVGTDKLVSDSSTKLLFSKFFHKTKKVESPTNSKANRTSWDQYRDQMRKQISAEKRKIWDEFYRPSAYNEDEEDFPVTTNDDGDENDKQQIEDDDDIVTGHEFELNEADEIANFEDLEREDAADEDYHKEKNSVNDNSDSDIGNDDEDDEIDEQEEQEAEEEEEEEEANNDEDGNNFEIEERDNDGEFDEEEDAVASGDAEDEDDLDDIELKDDESRSSSSLSDMTGPKIVHKPPIDDSDDDSDEGNSRFSVGAALTNADFDESNVTFANKTFDSSDNNESSEMDTTIVANHRTTSNIIDDSDDDSNFAPGVMSNDD